MRVPRVKIQRLMVTLIILAIFLWAGRDVSPDLVRRWENCRRRAASHAKKAAWLTPEVARLKPGTARYRRVRDRAAYHAEMSRKYRRALYIPWDSYSLGDDYNP